MTLSVRSPLRALVVLGLLALSTPARAERETPVPDADAIDRSARAALDEKQYAFCSNPRVPFAKRQQDLCALTNEIEGCDGFKKVCNKPAADDKLPSWWDKLVAALGAGAKVLLYALIGVIVLAIVIPLVRAAMKARRDAKVRTQEEKATNTATLLAPVPLHDITGITDAEHALRLAEEHRMRGDLDRALGLYLAASLSALDRRGAIRVAKHRTNGEYVRGCTDANAKPALREIVQTIDRVEFGGSAPTREGVDRVASRATSIVRAATMTALVALAIGCGGDRLFANDPAGDELPTEILSRNGFKVGRLSTSLATLPIPTPESDTPPIVIVDTERVPLDEDASAHLFRWTEAGGILVLFGSPGAWPKELGARSKIASTRDLVLRAKVDLGYDDDDDDTKPRWWSPPKKMVVRGARVAHARALDWSPSNSDVIAYLGDDTYAARKLSGKGLIIAVASDDLFTNVGVLPKHNATVLVALIRIASVDLTNEVRIARPEDGISPPSSPCAVLQAVGLGKGSWHAIIAAIVLFLAYGIRQARPRPTSAPLRRAYAEHVEATGALYGRAKATPLALAAYGRFVELRLRERVPRGADPISLLAARANVTPGEAAKVYERATKAKPDDAVQGDELQTISRLRDLLVKALAS